MSKGNFFEVGAWHNSNLADIIRVANLSKRDPAIEWAQQYVLNNPSALGAQVDELLPSGEVYQTVGTVNKNGEFHFELNYEEREDFPSEPNPLGL